MTLKLKSLKEPIEKSDGLRILIARRGFPYKPKSEWKMNAWWKKLAPSEQLRKEYPRRSIGLNTRDDFYLKSQGILKHCKKYMSCDS